MELLANSQLRWERYTGNPEQQDRSFNWPIDYSGAILDIRDDGHVEVLYRWAPNSYCHFHRHTAPTSSIVLEGELHVTDVIDGELQEVRVRKVGDWSHSPHTEDHMEKGGPEGALVLFQIHSVDGVLSQRIDRKGNVRNTITIDDLRRKAGAVV
ncbi:hypothetical protein [uncultured Erythrobacter sp.]|uniref:hypothetical protein n=1 Tax=uncultured Erythrobacter sp. TaxID=263913 RepID=UPI00260FBD58|nr:hypothetical protein [uncultured Erythrobacter sp.]